MLGCIFHDLILTLFRRPDLAKHVGYTAGMAKAGQRAQQDKKFINTNCVNDQFRIFKEFGEYLEKNRETLTYKNDTGTSAIEAKLIKSGANTYHVFLYDEKLFQEFTTHETWWDGTYKSRANIRGTAQLLTIMGRRNNKVKYYYYVMSYICVADRHKPWSSFFLEASA